MIERKHSFTVWVSRLRSPFLTIFLLLVFILAATAQQTVPPGDDPDEFLKIDSALVQTGVSVFDKRGRFIGDLSKKDFELKVDGKPVEVAFFERNLSSTSLARIAAFDNSPTRQIEKAPRADRRVFLFFIDDLHLSFPSQRRIKKLIDRFVDEEIGENDLVAIVSPSGKIGFLQQYTNDQLVIKTAIERAINARPNSAADRGQPPMSEYEALTIDRGDPEVTDIFVRILAKDMPGVRYETLKDMVLSRARTVLSIAARDSERTVAALEQAIRNSRRIAGRKVVFFISDGFLMDESNTNLSARISRVIDAASRTNSVIYSLDAKGLEAGLPGGTTGSEPASSAAFRVQSGERFELMDALSETAKRTGGKLIENTNDLTGGILNVVDEVSSYYLLAWEPTADISDKEKFRQVSVSIKDRPELVVRLQTGIITGAAQPEKSRATAAETEETDLRSAILDPLPKRDFPIAISLNYLEHAQQGAILAISAKVEPDTEASFPENRQLNLIAIVFDEDGRQIDLVRAVPAPRDPATATVEPGKRSVFFNHQIRVKPGLHQVRLAVRDENSGKTAGVSQWIEIPENSAKTLSMSSIIVAAGSDAFAGITDAPIEIGDVLAAGISVDRRFSRNSRLRYLVFAYPRESSARAGREPEIFVTTEVSSAGRPVLSGSARIGVTTADRSRLPYAAEIPLASLAAGRYLLKVKIEDRAAKQWVEKIVRFEIQ